MELEYSLYCEADKWRQMQHKTKDWFWRAETINNMKAERLAQTYCVMWTRKAEKWATVSYDELGLWFNQQRRDDPRGHQANMMTTTYCGHGTELWLRVCALLQHTHRSHLRPLWSFQVQQKDDDNINNKLLSPSVTRQTAPLDDSSHLLRINKLYWYEAPTAAGARRLLMGTTTSTHLNTLRQMIWVLVYKCTKCMCASSCQAVRGNERLMLSQALNHACKWICSANVQ